MRYLFFNNLRTCFLLAEPKDLLLFFGVDRFNSVAPYRFPFFHSSYEIRGIVMNASRVRT